MGSKWREELAKLKGNAGLRTNIYSIKVFIHFLMK